MGELRQLLDFTSSIAAEFLESLPQRPVLPALDVDELRRALGGPLPEETTSPIEVIAELARAADPGIAGMPSGRWISIVLGGSLPAALSAAWCPTARDQCARLFAPP